MPLNHWILPTVAEPPEKRPSKRYSPFKSPLSGYLWSCEKWTTTRTGRRSMANWALCMKDACQNNRKGRKAGRTSLYLSFYSEILPSIEIVTICQGMNFPLVCNAFLVAASSPLQQGTSMRTTVTLWMLLFWMICVSFSV